MPKPEDVFTPNSFPVHTYVERHADKLETNLANALKVKNAVISLSGPSKSGKTVLIKKVLDPNDLITISGSSISAPGDLWKIVLAWMEAPHETQRSSSTEKSLSGTGKLEGEANFIVAKSKAAGEVTLGKGSATSTTRTYAHDGLTAVANEIANSSFVIFIDDFHYIDREVQVAVGKEIKAGAEHGIRTCVASVPHRADDVVRSNKELSGRVHAIDSTYWEVDELEVIAKMGFNVLNVELAPRVIRRLATEALGSPQLMQALCLNLCFAKEIDSERQALARVDVSDKDMEAVLEITSAGSNYKSLLEELHKGPRQRGVERKEHQFSDGSTGDVYRAILLAIKSDPSRLNFDYDEMNNRVRAICVDGFPVGSSIAGALEQMDKIAEGKAIEWLDDVLDIVDPYFLFYLRASRELANLGD